jgi:hypothetical protein
MDLRQEDNKKIKEYMLFGGKYYNNSRCMVERGVIGGNDVSLYEGNLVNLESDLSPLGVYYKPQCLNKYEDVNNGLPCPGTRNSLAPQPSCKMNTYKPKYWD